MHHFEFQDPSRNFDNENLRLIDSLSSASNDFAPPDAADCLRDHREREVPPLVGDPSGLNGTAMYFCWLGLM